MRFGRLPHNLAALARFPAHRFGAVMPPPRIDRSAVSFAPGLYRNDILPDCTAVALVNAASATAALVGFTLSVRADLVPAFYAGCVGCPPTDAAMEATDGAVALDVLRRMGRVGYEIGQAVPLFGQAAVIEPASRAELASGIQRWTGYWGITLRDRDMQTVGTRWDTNGGDDGPIAGGHMVIAWDYTGLADDDTVRIGTWGAWQPATWRWVHARIEEAYGVAWPQLNAAPI